MKREVRTMTERERIRLTAMSTKAG